MGSWWRAHLDWRAPGRRRCRWAPPASWSARAPDSWAGATTATTGPATAALDQTTGADVTPAVYLRLLVTSQWQTHQLIRDCCVYQRMSQTVVRQIELKASSPKATAQLNKRSMQNVPSRRVDVGGYLLVLQTVAPDPFQQVAQAGNQCVFFHTNMQWLAMAQFKRLLAHLVDQNAFRLFV